MGRATLVRYSHTSGVGTLTYEDAAGLEMEVTRPEPTHPGDPGWDARAVLAARPMREIMEDQLFYATRRWLRSDLRPDT